MMPSGASDRTGGTSKGREVSSPLEPGRLDSFSNKVHFNNDNSASSSSLEKSMRKSRNQKSIDDDPSYLSGGRGKRYKSDTKYCPRPKRARMELALSVDAGELYHDFSSMPAIACDCLLKHVGENGLETYSHHTTLRERRLPSKLNYILSNPEYQSYISWMAHGRSWKIHNKEAFALKILPVFFDFQGIADFINHVKAWGFRQKSNTGGSDQNSYFHELFLRGKPHLSQLMRPLSEDERAKNDSIKVEPDFSAFPPVQDVIPSLPEDGINLSTLTNLVAARINSNIHESVSYPHVRDDRDRNLANTLMASSSRNAMSRTANNISGSDTVAHQYSPVVGLDVCPSRIAGAQTISGHYHGNPVAGLSRTEQQSRFHSSDDSCTQLPMASLPLRFDALQQMGEIDGSSIHVRSSIERAALNERLFSQSTETNIVRQVLRRDQGDTNQISLSELSRHSQRPLERRLFHSRPQDNHRVAMTDDAHRLLQQRVDRLRSSMQDIDTSITRLGRRVNFLQLQNQNQGLQLQNHGISEYQTNCGVDIIRPSISNSSIFLRASQSTSTEPMNSDQTGSRVWLPPLGPPPSANTMLHTLPAASFDGSSWMTENPEAFASIMSTSTNRNGDFRDNAID